MLHIFFKGWQNHPAESSEESVMGLIESGSSEWAACFNYTAFALFRFGEATSHNIAANCVPRTRYIPYMARYTLKKSRTTGHLS